MESWAQQAAYCQSDCIISSFEISMYAREYSRMSAVAEPHLGLPGLQPGSWPKKLVHKAMKRYRENWNYNRSKTILAVLTLTLANLWLRPWMCAHLYLSLHTCHWLFMFQIHCTVKVIAPSLPLRSTEHQHMLGDNALEIFTYLFIIMYCRKTVWGSDILISKYLIFLHKILIFL